ncbi:hypothetical protein EN739_24405 [Mesorhizobium sp. M2A.F.Ca.ET.017.03.2.1]|uniref:hypothetical protein n=1 Tax=unclassified Mesorhizobium TaxID=325217 RepID=UPI000FCAD6D2|nr:MULTISPECIES: hypothetical protein [unclassified Mesorhizobium]RUW39146.1 hypothetical protein EOA37_21080 [Mesorhizobium sp. M2A.F.Ca.ET.015.02.1.1]RVC92707.1 hypothetical protein EN739_24405 [Mesorhizobium sp. M2A.F.Ca.ET.017.03.2.1]
MAKYRKKPVVIEAIQFIGGADSAVEVMAFAGLPETAYVTFADGAEYIHIPTLEDGPNGEAKHVADVGDWIIRGVAGEHYPCKPTVFETTYEKVD